MTTKESGDLEQRIRKIENYLRNNPVNMQNNTLQATNTEIKMAYNLNTKVTQNTVKEDNKKVNNHNEQKNKATTYSNKVEEYWPQIVQELKQSGKIVLYTNLINTRAKEINDMTVGIELPNGLTSFGKTILEKQENIKELTNLVSMASGKSMNIKYIINTGNVKQTEEKNIKSIAKESDIPFNVIE